MVKDLKESERKVSEGLVYEETYSLTKVGGSNMVAIPKPVVRRKAKELGLTVEELKEKYAVIAFFDQFEEIDLAYKFVEKEKRE